MGDNSIASSLVKPKYDYDQLSFVGKGVDQVVYNLSIKDGDNVMKMTLKKVIGFILFVAFAASLIGIPLIFKAQERLIKQQAYHHEMRNFNLNEKLLKEAEPKLKNKAAEDANKRAINGLMPNQVVLADDRRAAFLKGKNESAYKKGTGEWDDNKILAQLLVEEPKLTKSQGANFALVENLAVYSLVEAEKQQLIVRDNQGLLMKSQDVLNERKQLTDQINLLTNQITKVQADYNRDTVTVGEKENKRVLTGTEIVQKWNKQDADIKELKTQLQNATNTLKQRANLTPEQAQKMQQELTDATNALKQRANLTPEQAQKMQQELTDATNALKQRANLTPEQAQNMTTELEKTKKQLNSTLQNFLKTESTQKDKN